MIEKKAKIPKISMSVVKHQDALGSERRDSHEIQWHFRKWLVVLKIMTDSTCTLIRFRFKLTVRDLHNKQSCELPPGEQAPLCMLHSGAVQLQTDTQTNPKCIWGILIICTAGVCKFAGFKVAHCFYFALGKHLFSSVQKKNRNHPRLDLKYLVINFLCKWAKVRRITGLVKMKYLNNVIKYWG